MGFRQNLYKMKCKSKDQTKEAAESIGKGTRRNVNRNTALYTMIDGII
jgi:hypothetical protein